MFISGKTDSPLLKKQMGLDDIRIVVQKKRVVENEGNQQEDAGLKKK